MKKTRRASTGRKKGENTKTRDKQETIWSYIFLNKEEGSTIEVSYRKEDDHQVGPGKISRMTYIILVMIFVGKEPKWIDGKVRGRAKRGGGLAQQIRER
jgi:hypothetical protein